MLLEQKYVWVKSYFDQLLSELISGMPLDLGLKLVLLENLVQSFPGKEIVRSWESGEWQLCIQKVYSNVDLITVRYYVSDNLCIIPCS